MLNILQKYCNARFAASVVRSQFVIIKDRGQYRIICQFIGSVIFKVSGSDLVNYLHQVIRIPIDAAFCAVIGLEKLFHELYQTNPGSEFYDEEQASIGRKIAAVEIYIDLLVAFKCNSEKPSGGQGRVMLWPSFYMQPPALLFMFSLFPGRCVRRLV